MTAHAAASPAAWLDTHLAPVFDAGGADAGDPIALDALLADDAAGLRDLHARLRADGIPARAAAKYLAGWYGGMAGAAVTYAALATGAGFLPGPSTLRWRRGADVWPAGLLLDGGAVLLPSGHAWSGLAGTTTVATPGALRSEVVDALAATLVPLVGALRELSTVGPAGLWSEIADCLGSPFAYGPALGATPARLAALRGLLDVPAPWRTTPTLWLARAGRERVCVVRKGGCCLAHTEPAPEAAEQNDDARRFAEAFPEPPRARRYCDDCSHRTPEDCEARQVWWRTLAQRQAATAAV